MIRAFLLPCFVFFVIGCKQEKQPVMHFPDYEKIGKVLDSIHIEDQKYRVQIDSINNGFGFDSQEMKDHWAVIMQSDSANLLVVEDVLDNYGWLGAEKIGYTANSTLFLVIQHSNLETQEKYLPMMRVAAMEGKARAKSLALLEDRIGLGKGELQIYGSQIGQDNDTGEMYVLPLYKPDSVNQRRLRVGLGSIENYISHWNIVWDVEEYKKKLPKWVEKLEARKK